jgi:DnaJ-class molecular chaperone
MEKQNKICQHCNGNGYIKVGEAFTDCNQCDNQGELDDDELRIILSNTIWSTQQGLRLMEEDCMK